MRLVHPVPSASEPSPSPELTRALRGATGVLFLCSGNVVRSAFAELYARYLEPSFPAASAATEFRNPHVFPQTVEALRARGVASAAILAFRPRHLEDVADELEAGTLVLGMGRAHLRSPRRLGVPAGRALLLASAVGEQQDIADPVLEGADFGRTYERVARCVEALVAAWPRRG